MAKQLGQDQFALSHDERVVLSVHWASWADALPMIQERHPTVADQIVHHLEGVPDSRRCFNGQLWPEG